jgi:hypothetical protein
MLVRFILPSLFISKFVIPRRFYSIMIFSLISCIFPVTQSFMLWILRRYLAPQIFFLPKMLFPYGIIFVLDSQHSTLDFWNVFLLTRLFIEIHSLEECEISNIHHRHTGTEVTIALCLENVFTHIFDGYMKIFRWSFRRSPNTCDFH